MAFKILLVLSLLINIGTFAISHTLVQKRITDEEEAHAQTQTTLDSTRQELTSTKTTLQNTEAELASTKTELAQTQQSLQNEKTARQQAETAAANARKAQRDAESKRDMVISENKAFFDLNMKVAEIKKIRDRLPKAEAELVTTKKELDIVATENRKLANTILKIRPPVEAPDLPEGLIGEVTTFDPRYEFVVLNIGAADGVKMHGEFMLSREGRYLGKAKVTRVEDQYSVANVLQDWKQGDVIEGDLAVYKGF
jgi:hypothetical protein